MIGSKSWHRLPLREIRQCPKDLTRNEAEGVYKGSQPLISLSTYNNVVCLPDTKLTAWLTMAAPTKYICCNSTIWSPSSIGLPVTTSPMFGEYTLCPSCERG